jgi:uncharacterized damage-inducible protein DinB
MRKVLGMVFAFAWAVALAPLAAAQAAQQPQAAPAVEIGAKAEMLRQFDDAAGKITQLAEKMSAENYAWRPMEGVRSTSEVFMHVASGCYGYARALGSPAPEGVNPREFDKITDKAQVVETVKKAIAHARAALEAADLDKQITFRRRPGATREAALALTVHLHEHLGQAIAYARSNKVVPPWSEGN